MFVFSLTGFLPFYDKNHLVLFEKVSHSNKSNLMPILQIQNVDYNWDDCPAVTPQGNVLLVNFQSQTLHCRSKTLHSKFAPEGFQETSYSRAGS